MKKKPLTIALVVAFLGIIGVVGFISFELFSKSYAPSTTSAGTEGCSPKGYGCGVIGFMEGSGGGCSIGGWVIDATNPNTAVDFKVYSEGIALE